MILKIWQLILFLGHDCNKNEQQQQLNTMIAPIELLENYRKIGRGHQASCFGKIQTKHAKSLSFKLLTDTNTP